MTTDPLELKEHTEQENKNKLNSLIAVTIAILATFMGICGIKAGNVDQSMRQAQAKSIDYWAWYQARNIREEVMRSTAAQLGAQALASPHAALADAAKKYEGMAADQEKKKNDLEKEAKAFDAEYDELGKTDDQFDLSEAMLAIAIAMLALAALTEKRWLFYLAMVPSAGGVFMGLAGLFGWPIDAGPLVRFLA